MAEAPETIPTLSYAGSTPYAQSYFPDLTQVVAVFAAIKTLVSDDLGARESAALNAAADAILSGATRFDQILGYFGDICCPLNPDFDLADAGAAYAAAVWQMPAGWQIPEGWQIPAGWQLIPAPDISNQLATASWGDLAKYVGLRCIQTILLEARKVVCDARLLKILRARHRRPIRVRGGGAEARGTVRPHSGRGIGSRHTRAVSHSG